MLARLSIRDIVLIERLDIDFPNGLAVLTGETGAGKSILLTPSRWPSAGAATPASFVTVRNRARSRQCSTWKSIRQRHPARERPGRYRRDDLAPRATCRRATRAFLNDQAISVQTLKAVGSTLVEIHGQHDERALVDTATHRRLLDAFAGLEKDVGSVEALWDARRSARTALEEHRAEWSVRREADYLRHASEELKTLNPQEGEETSLAERRTMMQVRRSPRICARRKPLSAVRVAGVVAAAAVRRLSGVRHGACAHRACGEGDGCRDQRAPKRPTSILMPH
jgi:DNA repair protein RecN (Recombination protein N)